MASEPSAVSRLFARPRAFDCECPRCGRVYLIRQQARSESVNVARGSKVGWDERASCLRCHCGATWIIGLAFWHPKKGPRRPALPRDQVPNRRQLAELRILEDRESRVQAGGVVAGQVETDPQTRPLKTNLVAECTCTHLAPPLQFTRILDEGCPIHGEDREAKTEHPPKT